MSKVALAVLCVVGIYGCGSSDYQGGGAQASAGAEATKIAAAVSDVEILTNGAFQGTLDPWWANGASLVNDGGMGCATYAQPGANAWDVLLGQSKLKLAKGGQYTVSFKAKASAGGSAKVVVQHDGAPYTAYLSQSISIGTALTDYSFTFTQADSDDNVAFLFQLGGDKANTFCVTSVSMRGPAADSSTDTPVPLATVRVNQLGFLTYAQKQATVVSSVTTPLNWRLLDGKGRQLAVGKTKPFGLNEASGEQVHIADFSSFVVPGSGYVLEVAGEKSHPFDIKGDLYRQMKYDALSFFYQQRSGIDIEAKYVQRPDLARAAGHKPEKVSCFKGVDDKGNTWPGCDFSLDVTGGWYDAGDQGKYVVNGGISTWFLMNLFERSQLNRSADRSAFADGRVKLPENANGKDDLLDEARWEMDFMLAMQVPEGKRVSVPVGNQLSHMDKLGLTEIDASGMVFHKVADEKWTGLPTPPASDPQPRWLSYPTTGATLNMAATAAQCARVWKEQDPAYAKRCLTAAERAWKAAKAHPDVYAYANFTGSGAYEDYDLSDEFYWAAAELYAATGAAEYEAAIKASPHYMTAPKGDVNGAGDLYWASLPVLGTVTLTTVPNKLQSADIAKGRNALMSGARGYQSQIAKEGYGLPMTMPSAYYWGSNSALLNRAMILGYAYDMTGDRKFLQAMASSVDYLLGRNPLDQSFVTGYGFRPVKNPHHRFWSHQNNAASPYAPPGVIVGGPNSSDLNDPVMAKLKGKCVKQTCWIDDIGAYTVNEVALNWNAPLLWTLSVLDDGGLSR